MRLVFLVDAGGCSLQIGGCPAVDRVAWVWCGVCGMVRCALSVRFQWLGEEVHVRTDMLRRGFPLASGQHMHSGLGEDGRMSGAGKKMASRGG